MAAFGTGSIFVNTRLKLLQWLKDIALWHDAFVFNSLEDFTQIPNSPTSSERIIAIVEYRPTKPRGDPVGIRMSTIIRCYFRIPVVVVPPASIKRADPWESPEFMLTVHNTVC